MARPAQEPLPLAADAPGPRLRTLADRCCALLARRGRPVPVGEIVREVLRVRGAPPRLQRRLVAEIVDADARLGWRGRDLVGLHLPAWSAASLADAEFCVVDLETTGGRPGVARIIEIGAVRVRRLRVVARHEELVDPGVPVPPAITALTGIDDALLSGRAEVGAALARFMDFCGDDVLVAHNAAFDMRFLDHERQRLEQGRFAQPCLDTLALARRLLRGRVARFDLASLAHWAMTRTRPGHRALADAEATAEVLAALAGILAERGEDSLATALRLARPHASRYGHKLVLAEGLPSRPGVYVMRDREGRALYVGRAANLRRRVRAHFGPAQPPGRRMGRVLQRLAAIDHEVLGSDLEAAIRECRLLAELRPPGNRAAGLSEARRYLKVTVGEAYPRCYAVARPRSDGAAYFGPLRSEPGARLVASAVTAVFGLRRCHPICASGSPVAVGGCPGPCGAADPAVYRVRVERALRTLQADGPALAALARELADAAAAGRVAPTGADRVMVEALIAAVARLARLRRGDGLDVAILREGVDGEAPVALFVRGGVLVHRATIDRPDELARGVALVRERPLVPPPTAVEEIDLVRGHLERAGDAATLVPLAGDVPAAELVERVRTAGAMLAGLLQAA